MSRIAWPRLMRLGLVDLRLKPDEFWNLTPAELMLMAGFDEPRAALSQAGLLDLMARYPDRMPATSKNRE